MSLKDKNVVVTGGSCGLGLGLVEALVAHGARVTVVARAANALASVRTRLGVATISADITDQKAAHRILAEARRREHYEKPSVKRKRKEAKRKKNARTQQG